MTAWISRALPRERLVAGIRCPQERRCWRTRGKGAGSCKTPDVVAWKSSSPCPRENDGPCLGTARGMDSAPLWGSQLQGSPLALPLPHTATVTPTRSPPPAQGTSPPQPTPRSQSWHWARWGLAPTQKAAAPCTHPLCPPPWGPHGPWGGDAAQAIRDTVLLWQSRAVRRECVCVGEAVFLRKPLVPEPRRCEQKHQGAPLKF